MSPNHSQSQLTKQLKISTIRFHGGLNWNTQTSGVWYNLRHRTYGKKTVARRKKEKPNARLTNTRGIGEKGGRAQNKRIKKDRLMNSSAQGHFGSLHACLLLRDITAGERVHLTRTISEEVCNRFWWKEADLPWTWPQPPPVRSRASPSECDGELNRLTIIAAREKKKKTRK